MGLDMYLKRKIYIGAEHDINEIEGEINLKKNGKKVDVNLSRVNCIEESIGYWRKANQIHNWFVENIQNGVDNCAEYYVSLSRLQELKSLCREVLDARGKADGEEIAEEFLPCIDGFFFGDTDICDYYYECLEDTIGIVEECEKYPESDFVYTSSW